MAHAVDDFGDCARAPPRKFSLSRAASWGAAAALVSVGALGLSTDLEFALFDGACILAGIAAAPPATAFLRRRGGFGAGAHILTACGALALAAGLDLARSDLLPAAFPVAAHARLVSFGVVNPANDGRQDGEGARKSAYLSQISAEIDSMRDGQTIDAAALAERQDLVARRREFTLAPAETALVDRLAQQVSASQRAQLPALRRAFISQLNGALSAYGLSARLIGDDGIEFDGAALADPEKQALMASLTRNQRALLGLKQMLFAAAAAPAEPPAAPIAQADLAEPGAGA